MEFFDRRKLFKSSLDFIIVRGSDSRTIGFNIIMFMISMLIGLGALIFFNDYPIEISIIIIIFKSIENGINIWLYGDTIRKSKNGDYNYISKLKEGEVL